ncbi:MAG: hypothetical protein NC094_11375 [Bacteroidales bacterium]|nr:hypothetical protein [Lachnoclostridium sp.]MCM1385195.1 hypothetical protein [Lachnoclostridium sp.]MCM1466008.1 hypothetical protein [Bacteroidales bacterium]
MDYAAFKQWLQHKKSMSTRSAADVISRCKRINKMTATDTIGDNTTAALAKTEAYAVLSSCIKSQLKRAVTLYLEFTQDT